jgi:magnesium chelatase subunit I
MSDETDIPIFPYTRIVGQDQLKLALELAYIAPSIGGVLVSGHRGTGKSTAVRSFARMIYDRIPVTLPINATEDRVIGGWDLYKLMLGEMVPQKGLLEEANEALLYIDEVNLLDDHIVNIILDVTSTGVLVIQREGRQEPPKPVSFTLVGTMNPEEGGLRPQLLDRFGLMVSVISIGDPYQRLQVLQAVIAFDRMKFLRKQGRTDQWFQDALIDDMRYKAKLEEARRQVYNIEMPEDIVRQCVSIATHFQVEGQRSDYVIALAARAYAARQGVHRVTAEHLQVVAPMALQHRRPQALQGIQMLWGEEDDRRLADLVSTAQVSKGG